VTRNHIPAEARDFFLCQIPGWLRGPLSLLFNW